MICPVQTPAVYKSATVIMYNVPTKTSTRGSREIERYLLALFNNAVVPIPTDKDHPLASTWERLEGLYDLDENWNGYDVAAPNPDAIEYAKTWIESLYLDTKSENSRWIAPHVTANENGDTVFEWSKGKKRLIVYVTSDVATYIKAWGPSVVTEMSDGEAMSSDARLSLWAWLTE